MYKLLLLFTLTFIMTFSSTGQEQKENAFAQRVLSAFQAKSFDNYKQVLVNRKDFEEVMTDIQQQSRMERQSDWKHAIEKFDQQAETTYRRQFKQLIEKGEKLGIDWTQVKFSDFIYQSGKAVNSSKTSLSGHINFTCKGTNYVLFGLEATELSSGYKVSGLRTVQKGGVKEYVDPDLMDDEDL